MQKVNQENQEVILTNEEKIATLKKIFSEDIELFGRFFFPHHLKLATPAFHKELYKTLSSDKLYIAWGAPRGHAKSTVVDLVYLSWAIIHRKVRFVLLISDTYTQAGMFLEALKAEFEKNDDLKAFYGKLVSDKWSEDEVIVNDVKVKALGAGMKVRGLKYKEFRPDLVICDDLENDEMVENQERREKLEQWFGGALTPSMAKGGRLVVIGTILHYDSLLAKLLMEDRYKEFFKKTYKAIMDGKALWEEHLNLEELDKLKEDFINKGQGFLFYREYMNDPISGENRKFKIETFKFITPEIEKYLTQKSLTNFIALDRGYSTSKTADATGIVVISVDKENIWYIQMAQRFKGNEKELVDKIFDLHRFFAPRKIGIEQKAFTYTLKPTLDDEMRKRNTFFTIEELKDLGRNKNIRIEGLIPRFETGSIFLRRDQTDLMDELTRFPKAPHDDLCDALAYLLELAESGPGHFGVASKPIKPFYPELGF